MRSSTRVSAFLRGELETDDIKTEWLTEEDKPHLVLHLQSRGVSIDIHLSKDVDPHTVVRWFADANGYVQKWFREVTLGAPEPTEKEGQTDRGLEAGAG